MRNRARAVAGAFPVNRRAGVLRMLHEFNHALESSGCCGLRPTALTQLKGSLP
jgi:hypothetical protein